MMKRNILVMEETFAPEYKRRILALLEGARGVIFMTLVTLWSLFGDDVRPAAFEEKDDPAFVGLTFTCLALFSLEMALLCVAKKGYPMSFYFWLDAIATLSLLLDVPDFMTLAGLRGDCSHDAYGHDLDAVDVSGGTSAGGDDGSEIDGAFARAARAARAGTRAGRIVRAIRLVRVAKLYSTWRLGREGELGADDAKKLDPTLNDDEVDFTAEETRVGQRLSDLTTRRVIVGVLGMLFVLPFFNVDTYDVGDDALPRDGGLRMLHDVLVMSPSPPGRGFYDAVDHFHASTPGLYALVLNGTRFDDHAATAFSPTGRGTPNLMRGVSIRGVRLAARGERPRPAVLRFFRRARREQSSGCPEHVSHGVRVRGSRRGRADVQSRRKLLSAQTHRADGEEGSGRERESADALRGERRRGSRGGADGDAAAGELHREDLRATRGRFRRGGVRDHRREHEARGRSIR